MSWEACARGAGRSWVGIGPMFWVGIGVGVVIGLLLAVFAVRLLASVDPLPDRKEMPLR